MYQTLNYSWISTNDHLSTSAIFLVLVDSPYIQSYFNLSTMATYQQQQQPLKLVPTVKITSRQNQLINDWWMVNTKVNPNFAL